jgi:hypothetical protein
MKERANGREEMERSILYHVAGHPQSTSPYRPIEPSLEPLGRTASMEFAEFARCFRSCRRSRGSRGASQQEPTSDLSLTLRSQNFHYTDAENTVL